MFQKQEKMLIAVCLIVAAIMLYATANSAFRLIRAFLLLVLQAY
ncbi:hypothetical protein [Paenibacillus fonticola]|nr:hypothetical protein [Paenibacillus fonticola]